MPTTINATRKAPEAPGARKSPGVAAGTSVPAAGNTDTSTDEPGPAPTPLPPSKSSPAPRQPSKSASVLKLLGRAKGATIAEIAEPTGWQPHSTRAYLSGLRKKGHQVIREERRSGETSYRIGVAAIPADKADLTPAVDAPIPAVSDATEANDGTAGAAGAAEPVDTEADAATTPEAAA